MPLDEEGAKWSCEPCIRGHRSSKCQHFDRLMMKVPKAGRPLAKCPHPKGTCSCQKTYAFMVRIPKGSTCLCRPLYKVPVADNDSEQSLPSMPKVSSPTSGKVQKPGARRQSHIQATPENIAKALEAMSDNVKLEDGIPNFMASPALHQPAQNGVVHTATAAATSLSHEVARTNPQVNGSSCCSQKTETSPPVSLGVGSCCSGKPTDSSTSHALSQPEQPKMNHSAAASWDEMSYVDYSSPQTLWQSSMTASQGQFMQSFGIQDSQSHQGQSLYINNYQPNMTSAQYSSAVNGLGIAAISHNVIPPFATHAQIPTHTATNSSDPCHDCKCGDECQCLGCAAHPFNNTTRQRVQEMGVMMAFNGEEHISDAMAKTYQPSPFGNTTSTLNYFMQHAPSMDRVGMHHQSSFDQYSDPTPTMPSGYPSPLPASNHSLNQQLMHPSEYYTLEYPVGIPSTCSDVTGSCQCENDCSCVGCLTHSGHNGVPLASQIPDHAVPAPGHQDSPHNQHQSQEQSQVSPPSSQQSHISELENIQCPA
ncbi:hypothetical protein N7495_002474 [Penicillium taxi]|uniref:uncharacterized protein n=1 Tax=Penicillium taxi TaxID=168475 RepID=UPI0025457B98|nr:uncharacterized protein N7495_002474 [Penicillium taxi]KAJ5901946.1 hypothetical protein N7495_002474 [Penicillium taxi]